MDEKKKVERPGQLPPPDENTSSANDFRYLAEALPAIVFSSTPDGRVDYFSARWGETVGLSADDPDYLNWHLRIHPDDLDGLAKSWETAVLAGQVYEGEFRLLTVDRDYLWFSTRVVPITDQSGNILRWYGVTTNIDDHKKMELRLRKVARQKDEFLAILGHELRNPLAAIRTSFEVVNRDAATEEQKERASELLDKQIDHLTRLVDDTLDISRLSSDKFRLITCPVEINQLVADCCESYQEDAATAGVTLEAFPLEAETWVNGDDVRITQCLTNLLHNAMKFTDPTGRVEVRVEMSETHTNIRVADTGVGMTEEEIARIFDPFEQGLGAQQLSTAGLGLGLAVIKKLIKMHGGRVSVTSRGKGHGSTFSIQLPLCDPPAKTSDADDLPGESHTHKIVLIEDNESVALSLEMFFELEGHEIKTVASGSAALELLEKETPDIIISDLTLPGHLSGWDVAERVTGSYPDTHRPYLIALSGHTQPHHREKSFEVGFDQHLAKPPTPDQLREALTKASDSLSQRRSQ